MFIKGSLVQPCPSELGLGGVGKSNQELEVWLTVVWGTAEAVGLGGAIRMGPGLQRFGYYGVGSGPCPNSGWCPEDQY